MLLGDEIGVIRPGEPAGEMALIAGSPHTASVVALRDSEILAMPGDVFFELAEKMGVFDHQISGRFSQMCSDGILYKTGQRRVKLGTNCQAEVYALSEKADRIEPVKLAYRSI